MGAYQAWREERTQYDLKVYDLSRVYDYDDTDGVYDYEFCMYIIFTHNILFFVDILESQCFTSLLVTYLES